MILKYNADEARSLKAYGELPEHGIRLPGILFHLRELLIQHLGTHTIFLLLSLSSSSAKINETDTFGPGDDDEIQFDDIGDDDEDIDDVSAHKYLGFIVCAVWVGGACSFSTVNQR